MIFTLFCLLLSSAALARGSSAAEEPLRTWSTPYEIEPLIQGLALEAQTHDGNPLSLRFEEIPPDQSGALESRIFAGEVDGEPGSIVLLAIHREDGAIAGMVISNQHGTLDIGSDGGSLTILQVAEAGGNLDLPPWGAEKALGLKSGPDEAGDPLVDVMVLYSQRALELIGGTTQIQSRIDLHVSQTNMFLGFSGATFRLRLVFTGWVAFDEGSDSADRYKVLDALQDPADGAMDEIHDWRDYYGADLVNLQTTVYAGVAFRSLKSENAFSVVNPGVNRSQYSFAHEIGHNFDLQHEYHYALQPAPVDPYNYGRTSCYTPYEECIKACPNPWCFPLCKSEWEACVPTWGTVMSYVGSDLRIPYYSTPERDYGGEPVGAGNSNNVGHLKGTAPIVAEHRSIGATAKEVQISPKGGSYPGVVTVNLDISDSVIGFEQIFYTLDGSEPTDHSTPYTGPFDLSIDTTLKAISYLGSQPTSTTAVAEFEIALQTEICDGLDNDLDGAIDEGNVCQCTTETYGGSDYLFCDEQLDWATGRAVCQGQGMDLVIVNDSAENAWVTTTADGTSRWLGLNDLDSEDDWQWVDGSALGYENWSAAEPNGGKDENCGMSWIFGQPGDGTWNDLYCDWTNAIVCE